MKLSVLLPELLPQYDFKLENEQEFSTLGLVVAEVKEPFCTFVDTEHALKDLHDGITMVITTPEIAPKLVKQGRGVCITEQPRVVFFRLHNALGPWRVCQSPTCYQDREKLLHQPPGRGSQGKCHHR